MHEMSYVIRFTNLALQTALQSGASKVYKVCVSVGEMTGVLPEYLHKYYPQAVKGTLLEDSVLETVMVPAKIRCEDCGCEYHPSREYEYKCPHCRSVRGKIIEGRGVTLTRIEMETDDPAREEDASLQERQ